MWVPLRGTPVTLTDDERLELERISRSHVVEHRRVIRAQLILLLADGVSVSDALP